MPPVFAVEVYDDGPRGLMQHARAVGQRGKHRVAQAGILAVLTRRAHDQRVILREVELGNGLKSIVALPYLERAYIAMAF